MMKKNIAVISFVMICIVATLMVGAPQFSATAAPLSNAALTVGTVILNPSHIGATNPGFQTGTCPTPPAGQEGWWGWHFIMPGNNQFTSLSVTFLNAGTFSADPFPGTAFVAHPDNSHAYIWTPTADTLLAGSATSDGDNTFFNLSHVCPSSDPTNTPTNTPTDTPTNTPTDTPTNTATNTPPADLGQLKVCKVAGAGVTPGSLFTINVNGVPYNVPAGPNNGFCVLAGQFPLNTNVTVQEVIPAGYIVARIEVLPNSRAVSKNLAIGKVVVKIGTGVTEAIFTNKASGLPTKTPTAIVTPRPTRTPVSTTPAPTGRLQ